MRFSFTSFGEVGANCFVTGIRTQPKRGDRLSRRRLSRKVGGGLHPLPSVPEDGHHLRLRERVALVERVPPPPRVGYRLAGPEDGWGSFLPEAPADLRKPGSVVSPVSRPGKEAGRGRKALMGRWWVHCTFGQQRPSEPRGVPMTTIEKLRSLARDLAGEAWDYKPPPPSRAGACPPEGRQGGDEAR